MSLRLVVMVSGNGSNLAAILEAIGAGTLDAEVLAVVSNRRDAYALQRAADAELSTIYAPLAPYRKQGRSRAEYDADLAELVGRLEPHQVVLAGWMHVLSPAFLERFEGRVLNLHPALPGELPGTDAIGRAWEEWQAGERDHTGVMVHVVVPEVDAGPVLGQQVVPMLPDEDFEDFEARLHTVEHTLLVDVLRTLAAEQHDPTAEA